jgi:hypothetical protein
VERIVFGKTLESVYEQFGYLQFDLFGTKRKIIESVKRKFLLTYFQYQNSRLVMAKNEEKIFLL